MKQQFAKYFSEVTYSRWADVQPPHVVVSTDGAHAWMAVEVEAQMNELASGAEQRFKSSWIAVYEKKNGKWRMQGIASSVVDEK
jgi:hypothetical protein